MKEERREKEARDTVANPAKVGMLWIQVFSLLGPLVFYSARVLTC